MTPEQERLIAILRYLEDWDKLNSTPVASVQDYRAGLVAFQAEVQEMPRIKLNVVGADNEAVWMEIPRLGKTPPPSIREELKKWITLRDDPKTRPEHLDSIVLPPVDGEEEGETIVFDHELKAAFNAYVENEWVSWSESEAIARRCITLYEKIFHLQQTIENAGAETPTEMVWGMGMAVWNAKGQKICHPLVTQQVEILPVEGDMTLRIRPTTRDPQIETDPFLPMEIPELPGFEKAARAFFTQVEATPSPFEPDSFSIIAQKAAGQLDTSGRYWPEETDYVSGALPAASQNLQITDSWVVFARKRSTNFLVDDLKRLQESIEEKGVPEGAPRHLVEEPEGALPDLPEIQFRGLSSAGNSGHAGAFQELFFPKPFNDEQVEIIRRLETLPGVVVQGPPGTGKTHTIANVICHYLARGKRVLVTSKGETALSVLQEQIPEHIRQLTVSLLTNERQGKEQLERAVDNINSKLTTLRAPELNSEIVALDEAIEGLHQRIASIDSELRSWARKNTMKSPDTIGGLAPEALAREVCAMESMHGWFPDVLDDRTDHEPAIADADIRSLGDARMRLNDKLEYAGVVLPSVTEFPFAARMSAVHQNLCEQGALAQLADESDLPRLPSHDDEALSVASRLHSETRDHLALIGHCEIEWLSQLRVKSRQRSQSGDHSVLLDTLNALRVEALDLHTRFSSYVATAIELPDCIRSDEGLQIAIGKAVEGKRPFSILPIGNKRTKEAFEQIRVNGAKPRSADEWRVVADYCGIVDQTQNLIHRWNKLAQGVGAPTVDGSPESCAQQLADHARSVENAITLGCNYDQTLADRVTQVFPSIHADKIDFESSFLKELEASLRIQLRQRQLASSRELAVSLCKRVTPLDCNLFRRMKAWLENSLGRTEHSASMIGEEWDAFIAELKQLHERENELTAIRQVTHAIEQRGAVDWARRLRSESVNGDADALLPTNWKEAWQWSRQRGYLQAIDGRGQILKLTCDRREAEVRLRTYESAIEKRTWLRLVENLRIDRAISRAITAYVQAIRGMTKSGKGKRDVKLRQAAREAMHLASRGVPCWIMPHWRVSEALPARLGDFDLVIVDEASQSDAWAVPSILRGNKVLIVGDDKQVGPQPSFTRQEQIDQIQERLKTAGLPSDIRNLLDPKASNYDLGELVFAGHTIRLREHFRCAEPIIEFSNKLCYDGEIKCVRVPAANERLLPTLVDVHVQTGSRDRIRKINMAEADAIVDEIAALVGDDSFGERSIGVVSLLGPDQGKLIFDSVLERIGEEAFLKHRIRCGDARTFQGSEADVIFISAVDDANSGAVMTHNLLDNIRRINVAVSRARDRLYFFHSFSRGDLGALDLRGRLMDHFKAPLQGLTDAQGRELCESGFEEEMFDALCALGYRVIPQVRAGNHRIDLVVEGHQGKRLAVECDGDQYHGPEKWMSDIGRQRLLERAGWKFWRCWGTSFARDKQGCLNDLIKSLREEGIEPMGEEGIDFSGIVEFREIEPAPDEVCDLQESDGRSEPPIPDVPKVEDPTAESVVLATPADSIATPTRTPDLFGNDFSDLPLYRQEDISRVSTVLSPTISIGDAVRFKISDGAGTREEYLMILNQPSNWKLGIVSSDEAIVQCLLGRTEGEKFDADVNGVTVHVEIIMKHEVNT